MCFISLVMLSESYDCDILNHLFDIYQLLLATTGFCSRKMLNTWYGPVGTPFF